MLRIKLTNHNNFESVSLLVCRFQLLFIHQCSWLKFCEHIKSQLDCAVLINSFFNLFLEFWFFWKRLKPSHDFVIFPFLCCFLIVPILFFFLCFPFSFKCFSLLCIIVNKRFLFSWILLDVVFHSLVHECVQSSLSFQEFFKCPPVWKECIWSEKHFSIYLDSLDHLILREFSESFLDWFKYFFWLLVLNIFSKTVPVFQNFFFFYIFFFCLCFYFFFISFPFLSFPCSSCVQHLFNMCWIVFLIFLCWCSFLCWCFSCIFPLFSQFFSEFLVLNHPFWIDFSISCEHKKTRCWEYVQHLFNTCSFFFSWKIPPDNIFILLKWDHSWFFLMHGFNDDPIHSDSWESNTHQDTHQFWIIVSIVVMREIESFFHVEKLRKQKQHRRAVKNFMCCCVAYPQKRFHCYKSHFQTICRNKKEFHRFFSQQSILKIFGIANILFWKILWHKKSL